MLTWTSSPRPQEDKWSNGSLSLLPLWTESQRSLTCTFWGCLHGILLASGLLNHSLWGKSTVWPVYDVSNTQNCWETLIPAHQVKEEDGQIKGWIENCKALEMKEKTKKKYKRSMSIFSSTKDIWEETAVAKSFSDVVSTFVQGDGAAALSDSLG